MDTKQPLGADTRGGPERPERHHRPLPGPARTAGETAITASGRMIALTVGAALFSFLFILSYGYAIHDPRPHHVRIDVVASAATVNAVRSDLTKTAPGGFNVHVSPDAQAARRDLLHGKAAGGLDRRNRRHATRSSWPPRPVSRCSN